MNEIKTVEKIKLPNKVKMDIIKRGVKQGSEKALKNPVAWAVALTSGAIKGIQEEDRDKGLQIIALLMAKEVVVKSVEEAVVIHKETLDIFRNLYKEEK